MTSSKLGFVGVFALVSLSALAFTVACGDRKFDDRDNDSDGNGNGGAGGEGSSSGGGGNTTEELRIRGELKAAAFNVSYEAKLMIDNAGSGLAVELSDGDLPRGLKLSKAGVLSGKPTEDGSFDFTVVASDDTKRTASLELTLVVTRKRWLAYVAKTGADGLPLLYVVDTSKAKFPTTLLSTNTAATDRVGYADYRFSADGSRIAFTVTDEDDEKSLFVVDLSGTTPGDAVRVDTSGVAVDVGGFALTPNGDGIAFHGEVTTDEWQLFYVRLDADGSSTPELIDDQSSGYESTWVTNDRIVYGTKGGTNASRVRDGDSFGALEPLHFGSHTAIHRPTERLLVAQAVAGCAMTGWLYDFENGGRESVAPADAGYQWPTYDSKLTRVAHADGDGGMFVFDAMETNSEPLGLVSPSFACEQVFWSPRANRVVMINDASPARLMVSTLGDDSFVTKEIPGAYAHLNSKQAGYVDDDRFVFAAGDVIYESTFDGDTPSEARPIHEPIDAATETIDQFSISPDGSWAFFFGEQSIPSAGSMRSYALDLRKEDPGAPRILTNSNVSGLEGGQSRTFDLPSSTLAWSADSSRLAFTTRRGTSSPYGTQLFVADMLHDTAVAVGVTAGTCYSGTTVKCEQVSSFLFQP